LQRASRAHAAAAAGDEVGSFMFAGHA
jgi:hypothetical protein